MKQSKRILLPMMMLIGISSINGCHNADNQCCDSKNCNEDTEEAENTDDTDQTVSIGGLTVNVSAEEQELDLFGTSGHRFWLQVSDAQLTELNMKEQGGGWMEDDVWKDDGSWNEDIYTPLTGESGALYADHLLIQDVLTQSVADYGKVEISLVGESTFRQWNRQRIPNIRIDSNEFVKETRIGSFEHLRLNNSLVGSIFRENIAHRIYRELGYPALRSTHVFLGSNVWGDNVWVPMTLMEMYKRRFCRDNEALIGGTCTNMWEFPGDLGGDWGIDIPLDPMKNDIAQSVPDYWCQVNSCDNTRLIELTNTLMATPANTGFKKALDPFIDWERFHEFQCLSWILWTGDDPLHNQNNNLIIERDSDGRLIWAPYSIDISLGQEWYTNVPLTGINFISSGCQKDHECWSDTIAICEKLIVQFDKLNPENFVDELVATLSGLEMMRRGDEERAKELRNWLLDRQTVLTEELERYRYLPDGEGNCPNDLERCADGTCATLEDCEQRLCMPGQKMCESLGYCYDPNYEYCPNCENDMPFYCGISDSCVDSLSTCAQLCEEMIDMSWCDRVNQCLYIGECDWYVDKDKEV